MIPPLIPLTGSPWNVLPPGVHSATLEEVEAVYATNRRRKELFEGLIIGALSLRSAGCGLIYLDGSYVTAKPKPGDFDACWDPTGVMQPLLDPVFGDFSNNRAAQKRVFGGEFFPSTITEARSKRAFLSFFQVDRHSGESKGILSISLKTDPALLRRVSK